MLSLAYFLLFLSLLMLDSDFAIGMYSLLRNSVHWNNVLWKSGPVIKMARPVRALYFLSVVSSLFS